MNTCLFCDQVIRHNLYVCHAHLPWYRAHKNEQWLQELIKMHLQQKRINMKECATINSNLIQRQNYTQTGEKTPQYTYETRGRKPRLNHSKIIRLKRYFTYKELAIMFETNDRTIKKIIRKKASYLVKK